MRWAEQFGIWGGVQGANIDSPQAELVGDSSKTPMEPRAGRYWVEVVGFEGWVLGS